MPSSTRQSTPGPSSTLTCLLAPSNTKKRAGSEDVEDARHSKKIKADGESLSNLSMNAQDKKKKKKKKKKRTSIVVSEAVQNKIVKSKSRTPSNKPTSVEKKETVANGPVDDTKHTTQKEPLLKSLNKGKGKARSDSPTSQVPIPASCSAAVASGSRDLNVILPDSIDHASEIARLKEQLASQDIFLQKHKAYLTQHQQALTCQICLDLMHKPFALAPCGHITCYNCLIRWFTAFQNPNAAGVANNDVDEVQLIVNSAEARRGTYLRRRKTCPVCRAVVLQRPVEMWGIKAMVATLVSSDLIDLPPPITPPNSTTPAGANNNSDANHDPWRYIFHHNPRQGPLVQNRAEHEHVGMYDIEDGGIYRCIDCFHEIWGGVCSGCNRGYPGHEWDGDDHDNDDDSENELFREELRHHHLVQALEDGDDEEEEDYDQFWDEGDEDHPHVNLHHNPVYPIHNYLFLNGDEGTTDSEGEGDNLQQFGIFNPFQPPFFGPPHLEGIAGIDEGSDEEHESNYGGSFIDDNEEEEEGIMNDGPEVFELDVSSDEEECTRPSRLLQARIQQRRRPLVVVSEDEEQEVVLDDDEANDSDLLARYLGRRNPRRRAAALSTDNSRSSGEEHDDAEGGQRFEVLSDDE